MTDGTPILPPAIADQFTVPHDADAAALATAFAADAKVHDEARDHVGREAIAAWRREAFEATRFTATPLSIRSEAGEQIVRARVDGDFPGSPVVLDHHFILNDRGLITALRIGPAR